MIGSFQTIRTFTAVTLFAASLSGCANMSSGEQRTMSGAAFGAAAGAIIGELATGQPLHGAAFGAMAGGAGGYLYNRHEQSMGY